MSTITTSDGCRLAYDLTGPASAPVLMLSNSLGTDIGLWSLQLPAFSSRFRVLRYDGRGQGGSDSPDGGYLLDRLGRDALELIDALALERIYFCGVSLGGMVGQWLCVHAPTRLFKAALCNTSSYMGPAQGWDARISAVRAGGMAAISDAVIGRWFTPVFTAQNGDAIAAARSMLLRATPGGYAGCCSAIRDMDMRAVPAPPTGLDVLVVSGSFDLATPPAHAEGVAARMNASRTVALPTAHLSNLESPNQFAEAVLDFLAGDRL